MGQLDPAIEEQLAHLSDEDWASLAARVRPPTSAAQLRDIAAKHIGGDRLEAFVSVASPKAFATRNGDVDEAKVQRALQTMFDVPPAPQAHQNFGQYAPQSDRGGPGDGGRAEARKRFSDNNGSQHRASGRGNGGYQEAQRRFGKEK